MDDISLDVIGYLEGTQKSSIWVDFLRHYERHLREYRNKEIQLLEIGILGGASLKIWKYYFPRATIIGVDIKEDCKQYETDRVIVEIGSQYDPEFLTTLSQKYHPTIIIDDGSHLAHHAPFTFERLFPILPPGGLYVIEDLFFHLGPNAAKWRGPAKITPPEYLAELTKLLLTEKPDYVGENSNREYFRNNIDEMAFVPNGAAFIRKKATSPSNEELIAQAEKYATSTGEAGHWIRLATYVRQKGGDPSLAVKAARKAIEIDPRSAVGHLALSHALLTAKDIDAAFKSAQDAASIDPKNYRVWDMFRQIYLARKDFISAEESARKALSLTKADFSMYVRLFDLLERKGDSEEAIALLKTALAHKPRKHWATRFKANLDRLERDALRKAHSAPR